MTDARLVHSGQLGQGGDGQRAGKPFAMDMLSSDLHSVRAVQVNIEIMRAFVRLQQLLSTHAVLAGKLDARKQKYDGQFRVLFEAIRQLMTSPPGPVRKRIGFGIG